MVDVRYEEVNLAVAIKVGCINSHARADRAGVIVSNAGFESYVGKCSMTGIEIKPVCRSVVADKKIGPSIVVNVHCNYAKCLAWVRRDPTFLTDVGKCSVSAVPVQSASLGGKVLWRAIDLGSL